MINIRGRFCQVIPSKVSQTKMCREFTKPSIKNDRINGRIGLSYGTCQEILREGLNM
jgi:hypothetical protein